MLLQKNEEGFEQPIVFYSKTLRGAPLRYNIMEKQAFSFIMEFYSQIVANVPPIVMKDILTQPDPEGRRSKWIAVLLEFDLEIKHTKLIKGQGLAKLMAQSGVDDVDINFMDVSIVFEQSH